MARRKPGPKAHARWEVGDVVYLKSGSPRWTVTQVLADHMVECAWSDWDTRVVSYETVPANALRSAYKKPEEGA